MTLPTDNIIQQDRKILTVKICTIIDQEQKKNLKKVFFFLVVPRLVVGPIKKLFFEASLMNKYLA